MRFTPVGAGVCRIWKTQVVESKRGSLSLALHPPTQTLGPFHTQFSPEPHE